MSRGTWEIFERNAEDSAYGTVTRSGRAFQLSSAVVCVAPLPSHGQQENSHDTLSTRGGSLTWIRFRLLPVRSPLLGESRLLSLRPGTEMFQFPGCPRQHYGFMLPCPGMNLGGLPHSEITGSWPACGSPVRFVARHVLPRHWFPEHPPYALSSLTTPPSAHRRRRGPKKPQV